MSSHKLADKKSVDIDEQILILVLHVDDETGFLDTTKKILEMNAPTLHVYDAASVNEAKQILQTKKIDIIISDYEMPDESGLEFLTELRKTKTNTPFILFTGKGREEIAIEALNIGADGYLNKMGKPATVYGQLVHSIYSCVKAKRSEDELAKFKTISDKAGYGVMLIELNGNIIYANESLAKMHGYATNELVGKNHLILHTKKTHTYIENSKKQLFETDYMVMEEKHLKKDGTLIPVLSNISIIKDKKGAPSFVAVIVTDITEKKIAEQNLKASEKRLRTTLDTMLEGCQIIDYNWRYIYVNDATVKHGRTTKKKLLGKTMMEVYPGIEETKLFSVLRRCMQERTTKHVENEFTYPNGEKSWFELRIQPVPEGIFILSIDITERKKAEETVKLSEEWYKTIFETTGTSMCIIEEEKTFYLVNREFEKLSGYSQKELKNKKWTDFVTPKYLERMKKYHEARRKNGEPAPKQYTFDFINKNGQIKNVMLRVDVIPGTKKSVTSIIDLTDRKIAQEKVKESERIFRRLFENMQEGVAIHEIMYDEKGRPENYWILDVNKKFESILSLKKNNIIGKSSTEAYKVKEPPFLEIYSKVSETGKPVHFEEYFQPMDKHFSISAFSIKKGRFATVFEDITERKKTEEKIQSLAKFPSENPNPVLRIQKNGKVLFTNKAAESVISESKQDKKHHTLKLIRKAAIDCLCSDSAKEIEISHRNKIFSFVFAPITDWNYCNVYGRDITKLKKAEKALTDAVAESALVNEKLSVVGKLTRHDVRNKLSVVAGNIFIAKELLPPDHDATQYLKKAEPAFEQIDHIFERAKIYERLGVDKLSYIDVKKNCEEALAIIDNLDNIKVVMDCRGLTVYADSLLEQLFYNLIDNSIKHGENVSKIRIYYKENKDGLKLIYEDNGVGITKAEKKKIFREGYGKGTGIGLRMIQMMCSIYDWTIQETGKKGKGARFTIMIPKKTKNGKKAYILSSEEN
ncbi:MAG: PAS domain S-box protein [Candidatus Bathyarchaeota archaeon]|nr:PAS domain S-box protein [Candidatus Bathyarchaeum sp.]